MESSLKGVSVDCVIFGFSGEELKVFLLKPKYTSSWCLPRGPVYENELLHAAAARVLRETTGMDNVFLQQFQAYGAIGRYKYYSKRRTRELLDNSSESMTGLSYESVISVGYYALVDFERTGSEILEGSQWSEISCMPDLLFDHNDMIDMALVTLRKDLRYLPIAKLLPEKFTLREMQQLYETILARKFDRRNFHKLLMGYDFLIKLPEKRMGVANKPPNLYKIDFDKYEAALQDGISY
ncbi:NUDIX domain-containing protein [Marinilongibacter aquaticus]|uniref:NrtR DNA-binding winged helix domain-containing protein n=1 Tax=Marinilongibacter aquaticus TaxID=2975157 RepID=UPI0021BDDFBC|nr:NUDIX domain-containing protein [Marinilongibacter aquaticus]UBM58004.1 NUDIX domain-containing protein [Marinilongibacter aquaticus]